MRERPDGAVDACFERIRQDPRHARIHRLGIEQGDLDRLCPDWAMNKLGVGLVTSRGWAISLALASARCAECRE